MERIEEQSGDQVAAKDEEEVDADSAGTDGNVGADLFAAKVFDENERDRERPQGVEMRHIAAVFAD